MSGSWEFSGEFKAFNHAKGRGRALSALVAHCQRSPIRSYPNSCSSGLWSTTTAEGRIGGVKCVVTFPQNVFPSLQLSAVWRVAKTYAACLYLIMLDGEKKNHKNPSGCSFFMLFTMLMILQTYAVSMLLSTSL